MFVIHVFWDENFVEGVDENGAGRGGGSGRAFGAVTVPGRMWAVAICAFLIFFFGFACLGVMVASTFGTGNAVGARGREVMETLAFVALQRLWFGGFGPVVFEENVDAVF